MKIAVLTWQPRRAVLLLLVLGSVLLLPAVASGTTYRVGPDEELTKVSQIADKLEAGDIVEIIGDITAVFTLRAHGTKDKPITIRGVTSETLDNYLRRHLEIMKLGIAALFLLLGVMVMVTG